MASGKKSGRFSFAVNAAMEAKDADHAFQAYLPPTPSSTYNNVSRSRPESHRESSLNRDIDANEALQQNTISDSKNITNNNRTSTTPAHNRPIYNPVSADGATLLAQSRSPIAMKSPIIKNELVNNYSEQSSNNAEMNASDFADALIREADEESSREKTLIQSIVDIVTLKNLGIMEKVMVISVVLLAIIVQLYSHSLYDMAYGGYTAFRTQTSTSLVHIQVEYFQGMQGIKTIVSIMVGTVLSLLFDAKPIAFDNLVLTQLQRYIFRPIRDLCDSFNQQLVKVLSTVQFVMRLWQNIPRILKYIVGVLLALSILRQLIRSLYVNVFVLYGENIAQASGFALILLILGFVGFGGYSLVRTRQLILTRRRAAVDAVSDAVIAFLYHVNRPEPISSIQHMLLDLEQLQKQYASTDSNSPSSNNHRSNDQKKPEIAIFLSPSAKQAMSSSSSAESISLQLPEQVLKITTISSIWQETVRKVSMDSRIRTTMRSVQGKNEQCWTFVATTFVSTSNR